MKFLKTAFAIAALGGAQLPPRHYFPSLDHRLGGALPKKPAEKTEEDLRRLAAAEERRTRRAARQSAERTKL